MSKQNGLKFPDITSETDLIYYLNDYNNRLEKREYLYHYTTLDKCIAIFRSKQWFLSKGQCMNDQLEYNNGDNAVWNNLFFASFMADANESIGMWSMYAQPWSNGVRIAIPVKIAKRWVKDISCVHEISCLNFKPTGETIVCNDRNNVFFSAVVYSTSNIESKNGILLKWSNRTNTHFTDMDFSSSITGYLKDSAWEYEKEIRIKAELEKGKMYNKIAIDIPQYVLDSMIITAGPLFQGNLMEKMQEYIKNEFNINTSKYTGKLIRDAICDQCPVKH